MDYYPPSGQKTLILTVKDILHSLYCLLLHVREDVGVGVHGNGCRGVSEHLLDDLGMDSLTQEQGCTSVPEVMEPRCVRKSSLEEQGFPGAIVQVVNADRRLHTSTEDPLACSLMSL